MPCTKNSAGGTMMNLYSLTKMVELSFTTKLSRITINGAQHFHHHRGDGSMSWMTVLNATALSLWLGLDYFFFPLLIWQLVVGLLVLRLSQVGTLTDSRLVILRVLIFSHAKLCQRLLMLWVILFFYFGVLSLREISSAGSNLGDSGILWRSRGCLCS